MAKSIFAGAVPMTEVYNRIYQGRNIDLDRIENAVRWADTGVMAPLTDLSRETVRNDPTLASLLLKRFGNIRTVDWDLAAASGSGVDENLAKEVADTTRQALVRMNGLRQGFYDLCWSRFDGRSALEIDWAFTGARRPWMPRGLHRIHPARLSLGPERELRVVERFRQVGYFHPIGPALRDVPGKFIWDLPSLFSDYQEREGLAPPSLYWSFFKRFSWRHRMVLTELFGIPWRIVEVDKDSPVTPEGLGDSLAAAEGLGSTTGAAFPSGHRLRLEAPHPESGTLFQMTSSEVNDELAKLITLQTSLTDSRDTNRASSVTATAQQDIVFQLDGNDVADRFQQQLVNVFVELNFGADALTHAPTLTLRTQPARDRKAELERVEKVLSFGVPVSEAEIREISGLRKPTADEPTIDGLPAPAAQPPSAPSSGEGPGGGPSLDDAEKDADLQAERIVRELFGDGAAGDGRAAGGHPPFGFGGGRPPLHAAVYGSPDALVDRGVGDAAAITGRWAEAMARAAGASPPTEVAQRAVLTQVVRHLDAAPLAEVVFRDVVHGLMLGALDAAWEGEHGAAIEPAKFDSDHGLAPAQGPEHLVPPGARGVKDFVATPFTEAVRDFAGRRVLPREQFLALTTEAKRRAFTVARASQQGMLETAHDELAKAIEKGADLREFAPALAKRFTDAGWTPLNPSHVENVFRTNVMGAYGNGRREQMTQPAVLRARPYWQILGVDDSRTRPSHKAAHGKVLRADDPFWQKASPPFGYQCFLPGTMVEGAFVSASRARYAGKAVELTTAVGARLAVTANHPVLTPKGFVPAHALRKGDQVLGYRGEPGVLALRQCSQRDEHHAPASVEEVFGALAQASRGSLTRPAPDDFHGEACRFDGDVEVVGAYVALLIDGDAGSAQRVGKLDLEAAEPARSRRGEVCDGIGRATLAANGGPCGGELTLGARPVEAAPLQPLRVGSAAHLDAALTEGADEGGAGDIALARELLHRHAGPVAVDELVDVREFEWSGHVFDVETSTGWLVAGGIFASNCRCRVISRSEADVTKRGLDVVEGDSLDLPDEDFDAKPMLGGAGPVVVPPRPEQIRERPPAEVVREAAGVGDVPAPPPAPPPPPLPPSPPAPPGGDDEPPERPGHGNNLAPGHPARAVLGLPPGDEIRHRAAKTATAHLPGGSEAQRDLRRGRAAHVFAEGVDLDELERRIWTEGTVDGEIRDHQRVWLRMNEPVGYRIDASGRRVPAYVAEIKVKRDKRGFWSYHLVPRVSVAKE